MDASERQPGLPQTRSTPSQRLLDACLSRPGGLERHELAAATEIEERRLPPVLSALLDKGKIVEEGGRFYAPEAAEEKPKPPRRDPIHAEIRAEEWRRIGELDPGAPDGGMDTEARILRRALREGAVCPPQVELTLRFDLDGDPAETERRAGAEHRRLRQAAEKDQKVTNGSLVPKQHRLRLFAEQHGTGSAAYERWDRENPAEPYGDRRNFYRGAKRALKRRRTVTQEIYDFMGRPPYEREETEDGGVLIRFDC
jgi:hypothetical protein